jgi:hypothetical protein
MSWGDEAWECIDRLLNGTVMRLPEGQWIKSKDGIERRQFRTKFWVDNPRTYRDIEFQPTGLPDYLADHIISDADRAQMLYYSEDEKPLFVGHYWRRGKPELIQSNIACLDYSAVRTGLLVAYRMDQETRLDASKLQWIEAPVLEA